MAHFSYGWFRLYRIQIEAETASEGPCVVVWHWLRNGALANDSHTLGYDIRFATGLEFIPYERQIYVHSPVVEHQFAIRVPKLNQGTNYVYLYTTNPLTTDGSDTEATWADGVQAKADVTVEVDWTFWNLKNPVMKHAYPHFSLGYSYLTPLEIVPIEPGSETLTDVVVKFTIDGDDLEAYHDRGTLTGCMYGKFHMVRFGDPDGEGWFASSPSGRSLAYDSFKDPITFYVQIPSLPPEGTVLWMYFGVPTSSIYTVYYAANAQPAPEGAIEVSAVFPDPWRIANPDGAPPMLVGEFDDNPGNYLPTGSDEDGPTDSIAVISELDTEKLLSASVSMEPHGVVTGTLSTTYEISVGEYVDVKDPITSTLIFRGIVTKCSYNYKTRRYDIQLRDPLQALSQGKVLFLETNPISVLNEVAQDYLQAFYSPLGTSAKLAPIEFGDVIDPEDMIDSDPADLVDLVRTVERIKTDAAFSYRPNGQYRLDSITDRGAVTDSQLLNAVTGFKNRYANRVICKASGEWWEDPGAETESSEWIRGATMIVTRYGDQVRKIRLTTDDLVYEEDYTYDSDFYVTKHEIVITQRILDPLSNYAYFRTSTTREWAITDDVFYVYTEEVISEQKLNGASEYTYQDRIVKTVTVAEGSITEESQRYGWNYEDSDWHVLMNDYEITGSGDEISSGDGSYYIIRGFTAQPGLSAYSVKTTYEYYWTDEIAGTYDMRLQRTEVLNSVPSAPGISRVLPLKKYSVSFCVIAEDLDAQAALGIKEYTYTPLCVNDDSSLTTMKAIAENTLAWCGRCRLLSGEVPLSLAEGWVIGDTFSWGGLTWTLENLNHDLKGRTTQITATAEASIAWLKKTLLPETDELGNGIHGVVRKEAEKVNNIEHVTIFRMIDYETYVVQLDNGEMKIAHLEFGSVGSLPVGASMYVIRESLL